MFIEPLQRHLLVCAQADVEDIMGREPEFCREVDGVVSAQTIFETSFASALPESGCAAAKRFGLRRSKSQARGFILPVARRQQGR
jgi:hypothetical protein